MWQSTAKLPDTRIHKDSSKQYSKEKLENRLRNKASKKEKNILCLQLSQNIDKIFMCIAFIIKIENYKQKYWAFQNRHSLLTRGNALKIWQSGVLKCQNSLNGTSQMV